MDPEHGLGASLGASRRNSAQRRLDSGASAQTTSAVSSFGRAILSFCLILLVLGVLPATFVFWACIIVVVFTFLRLRVQAQNIHQALEQEEHGGRGAASRLQLGPSGRAPVVRVLPGGGLLLLHTEPQAVLEQLNLQLRHLDEEMGFAGYDYDQPFMRAPHGSGLAAAASLSGPRPPPVSEADIAALPCYTYKPPRGSGAPAGGGPFANEPAAQAFTHAAAAGGSGTADGCNGNTRGPHEAISPSASVAAQQREAAGSCTGQPQGLGSGRVGGGCGSGLLSSSPSASSTAAVGGVDGGSVGDGRPAQHHGLTCPVCLDEVAEGSAVMTLPCLHQFHAACVTPWLRQQGIYATCPMCKTPVFQ